MKAPVLLRKVEPTYSPQGLAESIEGTVILELVVDEHGRPVDVSVISPLGFGLDEQAQAAVGKWVFRPGEKDGQPVRISTMIEVNFRIQGRIFDSKTEARRTAYNTAMRHLEDPHEKTRAHALQTIQRLSKENYPPAMYRESLLLEEGRLVPKDAEASARLLSKAADKGFGPALYETGKKYIEGTELPPDIEKGFGILRKAAALGSVQAQYYLASRYERGDGIPRDVERAHQYYRLCAAAKIPTCQFKLGQLLIDQTSRKERDSVEAIAWLQLAASQGHAQATELLARERRNLTPGQSARADKLTRQLTQLR